MSAPSPGTGRPGLNNEPVHSAPVRYPTFTYSRVSGVVRGECRGARASTRYLAMKDVDVTPGEESPYECFACGIIIRSEDNPVHCPDCNGPMRNRQTPLE